MTEQVGINGYSQNYNIDRDKDEVKFTWTLSGRAAGEGVQAWSNFLGSAAPYGPVVYQDTISATFPIEPNGKVQAWVQTTSGYKTPPMTADYTTSFGAPFSPAANCMMKVDNNLGLFNMSAESRYGVKALVWHLEGEGTTSTFNGSDNPVVYYQANIPVPSGTRVWSAFTGPQRNTDARGKAWGRVPSSTYGGTPFTWNVVTGGIWYSIPNVWMEVSNAKDDSQYHRNLMRLRSNWCDYAGLDLHVPDKAITVYGYESGKTDKPVMLQVKTVATKTSEGSPTAMLQVTKLIDIPTSSLENPGGFVLEFNWRLAKFRDEAAYALMKSDRNNDMDGYYGWVGHTGVNWSNCLTDKVGNPVTYGTDPLVYFPTGDGGTITGSVKDLYLIRLDSQEATPEYSQSFVVNNGMDNQQTVKTNDYAHATTDTMTWSWGFKWGMNQKVTIKWETDLGLTIPFAQTKAKFTFQVEAGFTEEWNEQTTHTVTDTKTFTMGGQSVVLPAKTAARVEALLMKVTGSGMLGKVVQITGTPFVTINPGPGYSGWDAPLQGSLVLNKVCAAIGMTSVKDGWTKDDGDHLPGLFVTPNMPFETRFGASGSVNIYTSPYLPPQGTEEVVASIGC